MVLLEIKCFLYNLIPFQLSLKWYVSSFVNTSHVKFRLSKYVNISMKNSVLRDFNVGQRL